MTRPPLQTDVLLANLDWARRLARALVLDDARADDLVQDAWLKTRSTGPTGRTTARRWLAGVMRNLARDDRRATARRERRELHAARPESAPSDDEMEQRIELQERLARWVLDLDEPYRRTLLLRWFEGLSVRNIAAAERTPKFTLAVTPVGILADVWATVPPLEPGEHRFIELKFKETDPHLTGRLVDPEGRPLVPQEADVDLGSSRPLAMLDIDLDGSFVLPLDALGEHQGAISGTVVVTMRPAGTSMSAVERLSGTFEAIRPPGVHAYDVGDVVLRSAPLLAEGRVVTSDGAPVPSARVQLYRKINQRPGSSDFDWSIGRVEPAYTNADGRFELRSEVGGDEYALRAHCRDHMDRGAIRFQRGARGLEFVVDRKRSINGTLLLPKGSAPSQFEVRAREAGTSRERLMYATSSSTPDATGAFEVVDLRPEPVTVSVYLPGIEEPIAEVRVGVPRFDDSEPIGGLDPWDLTETMVPLDFRVFLANGEPLTTGFAAIGPYVLEHDDGRVRSAVPKVWGKEVLRPCRRGDLVWEFDASGPARYEPSLVLSKQVTAPFRRTVTRSFKLAAGSSTRAIDSRGTDSVTWTVDIDPSELNKAMKAFVTASK